MTPPPVDLTKDLQASLQAAWESARERRHEYLTLEHVLLALLHRRPTDAREDFSRGRRRVRGGGRLSERWQWYQ